MSFEFVRRYILHFRELLPKISSNRIDQSCDIAKKINYTTYHLEYFCEIVDRAIAESHETINIGFYPIETVQNWHHDHQIEALAALDFYTKHNM